MTRKICGNSAANQEYLLREMFFGIKEIFSCFQCSDCKCIQIKDFPEDLKKYYPENYYSFENKLEDNKSIKELVLNNLNFSRDRCILFQEGLLGKILHKLRPDIEHKLNSLRFVNLNCDSNILDIGCGNGELLFHLKELGLKNLLGIDSFLKKDIIYKNGLTILKKSIEEFTEDYGFFDIIMLHHVFEHIEDPMKMLEKCNKILKDNGILLIRIPVSECYAWKTYEESWVKLDPPRHFFIHSLKSLNILLEKTGFEVQNTIYDSNEFQFRGSIQYEKNISITDEKSFALNPERSIFSKKEIRSFRKKAKELNRKNEGDQCIFIIRKF